MAVPLSAPSHDTTHTDMLLPGVHGEAAEEEASMLQPSISHQPDSGILQQPISHQTDDSLLQQSISHHTDSSLLQTSMSHSQGSDESLIQTEDLAGMQLISGDCNTVLQCDLSHPQTSLSVDSLGNSATPLQYNDTNSSTVTSLTHNSNLHCDLSVSSLSASLSHNSGQLPSMPPGTSSQNSSQSAQPTYITTTVPISSLLRPTGQQINSSEDISDTKLSYNQTHIQPQPTIKPTLLPNNILQQAIALNIPTNIVTALANLPFFQSNQPQTSGTNTPANQTPNVIPIAPAPVSSVYQALPTNLFRNFHGSPSASQGSNTVSVPLPPVLQRILPDTQKPPDGAATSNSNAATNIPISAVLSGTTVFCAPGNQSVAQLDSSLLPHILNSINAPVTASSTSTVVQHQPHFTNPVSMATSVLPSQSVSTATVVGMSLSSSSALLPTVTTASTGMSSSVTLPTTGTQISTDHTQAATYLSQFPMPLPVMSTQESSTMAPSDLQSLQTCLSHPLIQSLSQQNLVTSLASQIIFNPPRSQGTASPSFPQIDAQQTTHVNLLRQSGYTLPDSDTSGVMSNMSASSIPVSSTSSSSPQAPMESYAVPTHSGLSPMLPLSSHFQPSNMLPSVALSPSESLNQNLTTRLYLTSPMTVVPLSHDTPTQEKDQGTGESTGPAFTLANMSVIDMLLKHPTDLPDVDRAALPHKDTQPQPPQTKTPKIIGIYCVECNNSYKDGCRYHKMDYAYIPDRPVLSRAKLTLPTCFTLQTSGVKITSEEVNNLGVFANECVSKKTEFGPLIGKMVSEDSYSYTNSFTWKIFYNGHHNVIDVEDENECNWMIYVKPSPTLQEQNVVVYQRGEQLYFVTKKDIDPGTELLFWFAKDYAKLLGLPVKPSQLWPSNCPFCHICNKVFSDWKALSKHMKTEHPNSNSRKWPCQMCNRRFTSSTKLKTHMVALHMRLKPFTCPQCGKKFSDQSNLRQHQNIHTGERRFKCSMCTKTFRQKAHLQSHMIIHTGSEGLQCRFCSAKIARPSDLKSHELKHTKEKCYPCALCVKVFYKLSNYKKHMLVHNKERNFACADCGKSFYSRYHLTRHLKTCKRAKLGARGLGGSEENLYSTLDQDPQVEIDIVHDDSVILNTTTSITARLRTQRHDR